MYLQLWANSYTSPVCMKPYKGDDISCKNVKDGEAKQSRIIPESECMKRSVTTKSDITMQPDLAY